MGLGEALEERGAHRGLLWLGTSSEAARLAVGHRAPIGRHALAVCGDLRGRSRHELLHEGLGARLVRVRGRVRVRVGVRVRVRVRVRLGARL